jgi:hypothetical protein
MLQQPDTKLEFDPLSGLLLEEHAGHIQPAMTPPRALPCGKIDPVRLVLFRDFGSRPQELDCAPMHRRLPLKGRK